MEFVFVAAPYSHQNAEIRQKRIDIVNKSIAKLILIYPNWLFINPLAMHYVALEDKNIPTDYAFWQKRSRALIEKCDIFLIMNQINGLYNSKGLLDELSFFRETHPKKQVFNFTSLIQI